MCNGDNNVGDNGFRLWRKIENGDWQLVDMKSSWNRKPDQANDSIGWDWRVGVDSITTNNGRTTKVEMLHQDMFELPDTYRTNYNNGKELKVDYLMHIYIKDQGKFTIEDDDDGHNEAPMHRLRFFNAYSIAEAQMSVTFKKGTVTGVTDVTANDGMVRVYGLDGRLVYSGAASEMQLPRGLWIVTSATGSQKVRVQ